MTDRPTYEELEQRISLLETESAQQKRFETNNNAMFKISNAVNMTETEWKFRALFEKGPIGVAYHEMIYDTSGKPIDYRFLEVNEAYIELTGVDPRGKTATQAFPGIENDPFDWIGTYGHVARTGEQMRFEQYLQHNDCWYDCVAYQYKPDHFVSTFLNITERKRMEKAYKDSEFKYRSLIEHSSDVVFCVDQNGEYKFVNQVFASTFGKTPDYFLGKTFWDIYPKEHADYRQEASSRVFSTGESQSVEVVVPLPDRTLYYIAKANPVRDESGKVVLNLTHATDITERKQAEAEKAELEAQNRQLQKAESLGRMAGAIAHNFNNQLQVVMGNLEMTLNHLPRDETSVKYLNEAMKAANKSAEISSQMLTYLGQVIGKKETMDLSAVCRQSVTLLQAAAPNGVILKADLPFSGPLIRANMGQIQQVLTNVVTNAWEAAIEKQGVIGLTVKMLSLSRIPDAKRFPIDWQPQEINYACLEVADEGHGISDSHIEKLFDPFFTTKFTGRGLGLAVVIGIVQAHGGGITVESEAGRGSTFRVFLPVSTEEISLQQEKTVPAPKFEGGGTVLLIEDEEQVRNMAEIMLTHLGFTVLEAKDGIEAVEIFKQHPGEIRWVLSDLTMPRMDGWKTLAALRKLSPSIPVILSSGYDEVQVMADEHIERPNAFLGKPYQLKGLSETINRVLS